MPRTPAPHTSPRLTGERGPDDQLLVLLVATWVLATGRTPPDRPIDQLGPEELIAFWADDETAGR
ncbi:hypothetical protein AB0L05_24250 [Nonomuraea pusilla]|uniref:hypothetical protein n=1 Tax=Nonomuraea pusilla TaxID=46177 RepID=UPI0033240E3B